MSTIIGAPKFSSRAARVLFEAMQAFVAKRLPDMLKSRVAHQEIIGVLLSTLAGLCALGIRTGMLTRDEAVAGVPARFIEMLDRDLRDPGPAVGSG